MSDRMRECLRQAIVKRWPGSHVAVDRMLEVSILAGPSGFAPETLWLALEIATSPEESTSP